MSRAPWTLARRSTVSTWAVGEGARGWRRRRRRCVDSPSASDGRPSTIEAAPAPAAAPGGVEVAGDGAAPPSRPATAGRRRRPRRAGSAPTPPPAASSTSSTGDSSTTFTPCSSTASRRRRNRTGSSSLRSGASSSTVPPSAQTSSIVARGQPEDDLGGQAVAELAVDVVGADHALGELGPGVGGLVREAGAAEHAECRRPRSRARREGPRPAARSASFHDAATSSPSRRTSGPPRRPSLSPASQSKRPLSHSQPQLTGSRSTPWRRSTWLRLDSTVIRQPTEHVVHVDSTFSTSHGRALNRYGVGGQRADRADLHGVAGEVRGEGVVGERVDLGLVAPLAGS